MDKPYGVAAYSEALHQFTLAQCSHDHEGKDIAVQLAWYHCNDLYELMGADGRALVGAMPPRPLPIRLAAKKQQDEAQ